MNNQPQMPSQEVIDRHVAKMQALCERMDRHIADLDALNAQLEADFQNSKLAAFYRRRSERLAAQHQQTNSPA